MSSALPLQNLPIDLVYNYPLPGSRGQELMSGFAARLNADPAALMRYLPIEGLPEQVAVAANWLSLPGFVIQPERVGFGVSGHQLLMAILLACTRAGDAIACDPVTYNGWLNIVRLAGRRHVAISGDAQGMLPESLDAAAAREAIWGVFLMPSLHNPCATVMPLSRRQAIVEVCRRRGLWVIDDDAYRFLNSEAPPSFAHLMPESAFWLQSLTKPLFAGIKTSLLVSPERVALQVREALRATGHQPSALTLPWVLDLLASGRLGQLVVEKREEAVRRQAFAASALAGLRVGTTATSFHLWVELPKGWTSSSATTALREVGVGVVPGGNYAVDGAAPPAAIRVALAGEADPGRVSKGLQLVGKVLRREI